jgi:hypothetical protein
VSIVITREKEMNKMANTETLEGISPTVTEASGEQAKRFLQVGDEAMNRALANGDSEAFLTNSQQQGGE